MEMRLFEYALAIYQFKSFTKAAESLHIAQPSLSKQIAKLEQELDLTLFERYVNGIKLTEDGHIFIKHAEKILQMRDDLNRELLERKDGFAGELKIGCTATTGGHILPPLLSAYETKHPQVNIELVEASTKKLTEMTVSGEVDIAILSLPVDTRLHVQKILTESLYLVLPTAKKHWMSDQLYQAIQTNQKHIPIAALSDCPFILLKEGYGFRSTVMELCASGGFEPQIAYETSSMEMVQSLAANGFGITIVPEMARLHGKHKEALAFIQLDTKPTRTLVFAYRKQRYLSRNAKALMEINQATI